MVKRRQSRARLVVQVKFVTFGDFKEEGHILHFKLCHSSAPSLEISIEV